MTLKRLTATPRPATGRLIITADVAWLELAYAVDQARNPTFGGVRQGMRCWPPERLARLAGQLNR